ncbi:short-subunit dehydrogenase [Paraburkholderia sp. BL23I1N1]|nr:short-subunit dehydrogenase [Paraburkholderia sp. BL23I1N1]
MSITKLKNKQVLVTGASSGIGYETAIAFARGGANLILVDINAEGLAAAAESVRTHGVECLTFRADVADPQAMADLAQEVSESVGALDVLVNNAGVGFIGTFIETPVEIWRRLLNINLMGVVNGCSVFLPKMREAAGPRHIVNVASAAGLAPTCNMSAYAASKHAVVGLTDSLAMELAGSEVRVTVVCPGIINTPIAHASSANVGKSITREQLDRLAEFYRTKGAHPRVVGEAIVDAVLSDRGLVLVGPFARLIYNLRRVSRSLLFRVLIADSRKMGWI